METCREGESPGDAHEASSVLLFFIVTVQSTAFYPELGVSQFLREWPCSELADHSVTNKVHSIRSNFLYLWEAPLRCLF